MTTPGTITRVRAVVVNYNGGDEVLACLRSLLACKGPALEIVVVDNGSVDGSPERIEAELPDVRLFRSPGNLGYPAINQVVEDLNGIDAVFVVNPDAVVEPDCLAELSATLDADTGLSAACPLITLDGSYGEVHVGLDGSPRASLDLLDVQGAGSWHLTGARVRRRWKHGVAWSIGDGSVLRTTGQHVTLRVRAHRHGRLSLTSADQVVHAPVGRRASTVSITVEGERHRIVQNAGSVIGPHGLGINRGYHRPDGPAFAEPTDVPAWCGAGVLLRSSFFRYVGLFDARWFLYYEDTDLSWRGLLQGHGYRYVPTARITHAHSTTIGHGSARYDVQHHRNRLLTVTKCAPAREVAATWADALGLVGTQLRSDVVARLRDRRLPEPALTARRLQGLVGAAAMTPTVWRDRGQVRKGARPETSLPVLGRWSDPTGAS